MNKFSIPAFVEELTPDAVNAKYSKAKLKIYYIGETVDKRLFTKEFSDKLLSTIAYTPVVGFYSVSNDDFIGHNNVQHIYGLVPENANIEYVEDTNSGVTFAVTDVILYTGRPDDIGTIASKIVGKQHSLELDPNSIQYKINRDIYGNFKNIEFTDGELIGLSVLGDNDTPAFTGSEFFSAEELPEFITNENKGRYQALFSAMFNVEPTAEEVVNEIYRTLESQNIYGFVCEHKAEQYVVVCSDYGIYNRYLLSRDETGALQVALDCPVRNRYISDEEIEVLVNSKKGPTNTVENDNQAQIEPVVGAEANEDDSPAAFTDSGDITDAANDTDEDEDKKSRECEATENDNPEEKEEKQDDNDNSDNDKDEEFEALRSNCERLEGLVSEAQSTIDSLTTSHNEMTEQFNTLQAFCRENIINYYSNVLDTVTIEECKNNSNSVEELANKLAEAHRIAQANNETVIFEISNISNLPSDYNECDEAAVVEKYKNKVRGKN